MVVLEGAIKRLSGNSSDTKPLLERSDAGSLFTEKDTGRVSRWDGKNWVEVPQQDFNAALLAAQERTNELLELVIEKL